MNNIILSFLDEYKRLDELCKQIFSSDIGVTKYIEEMEKEIHGSFYVTNWEKIYKKLKHMRWVRNQLVHDPNSFKNNIVTTDDIEWLKEFQSMIINCTDPFGLLNQYRNQNARVDITYKFTPNNTKYDDKKNPQKLLFILIMLAIIVWILVFIKIICF